LTGSRAFAGAIKRTKEKIMADTDNWRDSEHEANFRAAVASPRFSHARARRWGGAWIVHVYHRDPTSPSGVMCAAGASQSLADPIIAEFKRAGALSPTERL